MAKKRDDAEIEAVRRELPLVLPPDVLADVKKKMISRNLLIFRIGYVGGKRRAIVTCSCCGQTFTCDYEKDAFGEFCVLLPNEYHSCKGGSIYQCPECGEGAVLIKSTVVGQYGYEVGACHAAVVDVIRDHLVVYSFYISEVCDREGNISYTVNAVKAIAVIGNKPVSYVAYANGMMGARIYIQKWTARVNFYPDFYYDYISCRDKYLNSDASKSALDVFVKNSQRCACDLRVGGYLQLWAKYPQVENLVRNGFSLFVSSVIQKATTYVGYYGVGQEFRISKVPKYFNVKKVKPCEMLGLDKSEIELLKNFNFETFEFYRKIKLERNIRLTRDYLNKVEKMDYFGFSDIFDTAKALDVKLPVLKSINYLSKHKTTVHFYGDYLKMTAEIQDGIPPELLFPKDLKRAHDEAIIRRREKVNANISKKIAEYSKTLEKMSFSDRETGLLIRPAANQEELIKEGKVLSHCVATYATRVSERITSIWFIRRIDDPDMPFFTLEYSRGCVIQNRGLKNCDRTPEVVEFEKKWLEYLEKIKNRKENLKNGKQQRSDELVGQRAGA